MNIFDLIVKLPVALVVDTVKAPIQVAEAVVHGDAVQGRYENTEKVLDDDE